MTTKLLVEAVMMAIAIVQEVMSRTLAGGYRSDSGLRSHALKENVRDDVTDTHKMQTCIQQAHDFLAVRTSRPYTLIDRAVDHAQHRKASARSDMRAKSTESASSTNHSRYLVGLLAESRR
jgi:hypothetical protein